MILSNTAEFTPWVIQPKKENQFTEFTNLTRPINSEKYNDEDELKVSESVTAEAQDGEQFDDTDLQDNDESVSQKDSEIREVEETLPPELIPKYTTAEFKEYGEAEYLRGYNSCKENEQLEFSGRLEQLDNLLATISNEYVDLNVLKDFILYWKSTGEYGTKLSLHPEPFDDGNHFIWYDIRPNDLSDSLIKKLKIPFMQYYRFAYIYSDPKTGILNGLKDFKEKYLFVTQNEQTTPKRKQKRNDDEDSNHR